jgi:hypothetical protein
MLRHEIAMQLFLQISVRPNLTQVCSRLCRVFLYCPCVHAKILAFGVRTYHSALEGFIGAPSV